MAALSRATPFSSRSLCLVSKCLLMFLRVMLTRHTGQNTCPADKVGTGAFMKLSMLETSESKEHTNKSNTRTNTHKDIRETSESTEHTNKSNTHTNTHKDIRSPRLARCWRSRKLARCSRSRKLAECWRSPRLASSRACTGESTRQTDLPVLRSPNLLPPGFTLCTPM